TSVCTMKASLLRKASKFHEGMEESQTSLSKAERDLSSSVATTKCHGVPERHAGSASDINPPHERELFS
ncbi:hypothetical protein KUCAC02_008696, partial [Chaenocephalus aceratus]